MCSVELPVVEAVRRGAVSEDCSAERLGALLDAGLDVGAVARSLSRLRDVGAVRLLLERCGDDPVVLDALRLSRFAEPVVLENLGLFCAGPAVVSDDPGEWSPVQWVQKIRAGEVTSGVAESIRGGLRSMSVPVMSVEDWVLFFGELPKLGVPLPGFWELPAGDEVARVFHDAVVAGVAAIEADPEVGMRLYGGFLERSGWDGNGWQAHVISRGFPRIVPPSTFSPGLISALSHVQPLTCGEAVGLCGSLVEVPHLFIEPSVESLQHPELCTALGSEESGTFPGLVWGGSQADMAAAVLEWFDLLRREGLGCAKPASWVSSSEDDGPTTFEVLVDTHEGVRAAAWEFLEEQIGAGGLEVYRAFRDSGKFSVRMLDAVLLEHLRTAELSSEFVHKVLSIPGISGLVLPVLEEAWLAGRVFDQEGNLASRLVYESLSDLRRPHPRIMECSLQGGLWPGWNSPRTPLGVSERRSAFFYEEIVPYLRKARVTLREWRVVYHLRARPQVAAALLKEGIIQGEALRALVSMPDFSDELDGYLHGKLGDRPEVWRLYGSLLEDWEGSLPDLTDLANTLSEN